MGDGGEIAVPADGREADEAVQHVPAGEDRGVRGGKGHETNGSGGGSGSPALCALTPGRATPPGGAGGSSQGVTCSFRTRPSRLCSGSNTRVSPPQRATFTPHPA